MLRSTKGSTSYRSNSGPTGISGSSNSSTFRNGGSGSNTGSGSSENNLHPNLGLHSAAATGNIGLVKFALDNGQPHTSILNGLLPLHAACSGGSEPVVRLLLQYGADVNATRIKTSKSQSGVGQGTGTEGSTSLHFAAANGHVAIVRLLLENGARPTAYDRDGLTPMSLASTQNHTACVSLINSWIGAYGPNGLAGPSSTPSSFLEPGQANQQTSSSLRSQRSFESLSSAAAGVKASLRNHKKQALAKVNSNPNLKAIASSSSNYTSPSSQPPPPLPTAGRAGHDALKEGESPQSTPPQTLSAASTLLTRESKRRPSLPSIFEKASHPSSTFRSILPTHSSSQTNLTEPVEELTSDLNPPPSPNRQTHRLTVKKSLTGLFGKASLSSTNSEDVSSSSSSSPLDVRRGSRVDGRTDVDQLPESLHDKSELGSTSSFENDAVTRHNNASVHAFRPRKSSNLSTRPKNISPLRSQDGIVSTIDQGRKRSQSTTSVPKRSSPAPESDSFRKFSFSRRGSHKTPSEFHSDEAKEILTSSTHSDFKDRSSTPTKFRSHRSPLLVSKTLAEEGDSKGSFLSTNPSSPSLGLRQLHSQRSTSSLVSSSSSNNANHEKSRSNSHSRPEEDGSKTYLEPGNTLRTYRSPSYAESTTSKTSTSSVRSFSGSGLTAQEQAQAILRTADEGGVPSSGEVPFINLTQMLASYGEALAQERRVSGQSSYSPLSIRKQASLASLGSNNRSHQLPSVTEAAVKSHSDLISPSVARLQPGSFTSTSTPPDSPQTTASRAESSATSFSRSPSSHRQKVPIRDMNKVVTEVNGLILTPPYHTSSPSAGPVLSTSPKSGFKGRNLDSQWLDFGQQQSRGDPIRGKSTKKTSPPPSIAVPTHRHSPSLPTDLSQFTGNASKMVPSDTEMTPKSKRQISRRPTTADSTSSYDHLRIKRVDVPSFASVDRSNGSFAPRLHKMHSAVDLTGHRQASFSPEERSNEESAPATFRSTLNVPTSTRRDDEQDTLPGLTGKRRGSVKAFLHGIKNNVVR